MTNFNVVVDTSAFDKKLTQVEREQLPFARSLAANTAAFETMGTMRKAMPLYIDAPSPFSVRSVRYRRGTKQSPAAEVYISGDAAKGTPPSKYLTVTRGGVRGQRRSERVLRRAGLISADEGWVPGKAVKLNRFGNVPASKVIQILSGIKAFGEEGFTANITAGSRARGARKGRAEYFVSRGGKLPRGVYERYGSRKKAKYKYGKLPAGRKLTARSVRPVMLFVPLPIYAKEFDFQLLSATEARRRFLKAWPSSLARAVRTAK